jgi:esterase/lipase
MALFYFFQEKFIFQNEKLESNYSFSFEQNFEEINLKTEDNNNINALLFKSKNSKGVVLYFHGNKGNLSRWGNIASYFTNFDHDVFVMDYRSYGKSTGDFNEEKMYNDAQICYDYLKNIYAENKITIYGRSLGCTFAVKMASINKPKQLILESPFFNLKDAVKYHYPFLPFKFLLKYKFRSDQNINNVRCKTTMFHGIKDKVVPISSGEKLFKKSNKDHTSFITIEKGTHHNLIDFKIYQDSISTLLAN